VQRPQIRSTPAQTPGLSSGNTAGYPISTPQIGLVTFPALAAGAASYDSGGFGNAIDTDALQAQNAVMHAQSSAAVAAIGSANGATLSSVGINRNNGNTAQDALMASYPGAMKDVHFDGARGKRFMDIVTGNHGIESKVGRTGMDVAIQVLKDRGILTSGALTSIEWEFKASPITDKVGPTKGLRDLLSENNIPWRIG